MSNFEINEIIEALRNVPNSLADKTLPPPKFQKKILQTLDPSKTTVAVYSDNLINDHDKWNDIKGSIEESVSGRRPGEQVGFEALAWYVSFHHTQKNWGIYIPVSSIHYLNEVLQIKVQSHINLDQISKNVLFFHEIYHFLTDLAISQLELLTKHPMYRVHKNLYKNKAAGLISSEEYNELEENLANAFMLGEIQSLISDHQLQNIIAWVETMPAGYREGGKTFLSYNTKSLQKDNLNRYAGIAAAKTKLNIVDQALDLTVFIPKPLTNIVDQCPIYILDDTNETGLDPDIVRFFHRMEEIEETKPFKKMFVKLPQKIQNAWIKKRELLKEFLPKPPQFKKFKDYYALYLPDGYRAHFIKPNKNETRWLAVEIGNHQSMGHGK